MLPDFKKKIVFATNNLWKGNTGIFNLLNKLDENIKNKFEVYKFDKCGLVEKNFFLRKIKIFLTKRFRDIDFQRDFQKFLEEKRPDIVDVKIENFYLSESLANTMKFIGRSHGIFYKINETEKKNICSFLSHAHKIILPHKGDLETLKLLDKDLFEKNKNKIFIIPSFIDQNLDYTLTKNINDILNSYKKNEIAFLGSWSTRKGSNHIPEIIKRNLKDNTNTTFVFLGTNVEKNEILSEFDENEKRNYFNRIKIVKSFNKYQDLKKLLKNVKLGIMPSNFEGSPSGLLELMSSSIPTICFNLPGIKDILEPFEKDLLVEKQNIDDFQLKLNKLICLNEEDFITLSKKVKNRSKYFLENNIFPNYLKIIESL